MEKKNGQPEIHSGHEEARALLDQEWLQTEKNEVIKKLKSGEDLQMILESLPEFSEAFEKPLDIIDCSDGRVLLGKKIGIAGSGILLSEKERNEFVKKYKGKIKIVTSHDDCGAAKLKFNELRDNHLMPFEIVNSDKYGALQAGILAKELGAEHMHLTIDKMAAEVHNERGMVIDATGRFNSTNLKGFPPHFVASGFGFGLSAEYMKKEISILAGIALGDHGFGQRFTASEPFYLMVVANDSAEREAIEWTAEEAAAGFGNRVKVLGCLKPDAVSEN